MRDRRHHVRLKIRQVSQNAAGETVETYRDIGGAWCAIEARTGRELDQAGRFLIEEDTFALTFRHSTKIAGLTAADQIHDGATIYEATSNPLDRTGRGRELVIQAKTVRPTVFP